MTLPGKLCIGILEEDNPLRSYFRFKPLLIDQDGRYVPYENVDQYPDEGCIRIVPDKNESYYFKARMRENGLFCVVDLRDHPGESDKIRPNKNYRPGGEEINGCIVYSDVVRAPVADMIFQVLPSESAGAIVPEPHTPVVLLRRENALLPTRHTWESVDAAGSMALLKDTGEACPVEELQVFDLPGFRGETVSFAIFPAAKLEAVSEAPERPARKVEEKHPAEPAKAEAEPAKAEAEPAEKPVPEKPRKPAPEPQEKPAERPEKDAPEAEAPERADDIPAPEAPAEDKPWIHRDASMLPRPVDRRLSRSEQLMAAQAGLNPRRGRSLQELIDEKWTRSRISHLGMPVSPVATGAPVTNPVDTAIAAVRKVWEKPQLREQLMQAIAEAEDIGAMLHIRRDVVMKSSINREMTDLEAQRLELMGEIERLKTLNQKTRERLKQEILKDEAAAFEEATGKTRAAQAKQAQYEQQAQEARAAAEDARGLLDALTGEELERKIRDVALTRRVAERLELLKDASEASVAPPKAEAIDLPAFVSRFSSRLSAAGWQVDTFEAANLCACLAIAPVLTLSGAPGSGKTRTARLLAEALGVAPAGRLAVCPAGEAPLREDPAVKALTRCPDAPTLLVLDDANLAPAADPLRGMGSLPGPEWRLIVTLQDSHSGLPVSAAALDKGFLVRLTVPEDLPWRPAEERALGDEAPASLAALRDALPQAEVPQRIIDRMEALRGVLAKLGAPVSRRALDDCWRYCAAMGALMEGTEDIGDRAFDCAVAQRILPAVIAAAPPQALAALADLTRELPRCAALLRQPLPISI